MRVTKVNSRTVKTYEVNIEDGEVRDERYSATGRRYQVDQATIIKRDGNVFAVKLHGPALKKDGHPSRNRISETLYSQREWPEWLPSVVGGLA